ncbi:MAG: hypothetical protein IT350_07965 [Deltaproteobacteria bacterium]|nr:hypothetical protein [Deltaproteobacteria bacterium]
MSCYFFAVGGTGQTVLLNYLRLAFIAGFKPAPFYVIDADVSGPLTESIALYANLTGRERGEGTPHIVPFPHLARQDSSNARVLADGGAEEIDLVLRAFYSADELNGDPHHGFFGLPAIASAIAAKKIHLVENAADFGGDVEFKNVSEALKRQETKSVAFVGSNYGGTGAGVMPTFARYFKRLAPTHNRVSVLCLMPWFQLRVSEHPAQQGEPTIRHEQLIRNSEGGLAYYGDEFRRGIDEFVFLGRSDFEERVYSRAYRDQPEHQHPINLLAALMAHESLSADSAPTVRDALGTGNFMSYWKKENGADLLDYPVRKGLGNDAPAIAFGKAITVFIGRESMMRSFREFLSPLPSTTLDFFPNRVVPARLRLAVERIARETGTSKDAVIGRLRGVVEARLKHYKSVMDWLFGGPRAPQGESREGIQRERFLEFTRDDLRPRGSKFEDYQRFPTTFFHDAFRGDGGLKIGDARTPQIRNVEALANQIESVFQTALEGIVRAGA